MPGVVIEGERGMDLSVARARIQAVWLTIRRVDTQGPLFARSVPQAAHLDLLDAWSVFRCLSRFERSSARAVGRRV